MDANDPTFLQPFLEPGTLRRDGSRLRGDLRGPAVRCWFEASAGTGDRGTIDAATRFDVTLEMELPDLDELQLALTETLSATRDPERDLADELREASDPGLARRWFDDAVRAAWLAIPSDWRYENACTLVVAGGRCTLAGQVAGWDRRRMGKLIAVMIALSTAPVRRIDETPTRARRVADLG